MTKKKKFYAVARGRRPGVYTAWFGANGAEAQVSGYPGARYKGFATRREAESFIESGGASTADREKSNRGPSKQNRRDPVGDRPADGTVALYTDGGALGNPGPGGYGVVLIKGDERTELSGGFRCTTNNRMELMACIVGLAALAEPSRVTLTSDSKYVVDAVTKGWARRWQANGWMRSGSQKASNPDLWERLLAQCDRHEVDFHWVKGHAGHPENERCDQLVKQAAAGADLPQDEGYCPD